MKELLICKNKKSKYVIVVSPVHDKNYRAAVLLQSALYRVTGASLPIVIDSEAEPSRYEIIVGQTNRENVTHPYDREGILEIGFSIFAHKDLLILSGGSYHGATFAVYAFVEQFLHYEPIHPWQTQNPPKLDEVRVPADFNFENSPRSWVQNIPERKSKGAHIYMIPTYALSKAGTTARGMGYVIRSANGKLMVIDGGHATDAPLIVDLLKKLSGQEIPEVEGWFMTHPHPDHINALWQISKNMPNAIKLKCFYHNMPTPNFCKMWGAIGHLQKMNEMRDSGFCRCQVLRTGDTLEVDGVKMEVVYAFNPKLERYLNKRIKDAEVSINRPTGDAINDADTLYKFTADGHTALFIGDFMHYGEDYLYEKHPEVVKNLKADMIQVCHHGSNFLSQKFYHHVNARVALWSNTPDAWIMPPRSLNQVRNRLFELRIVKNHLAGNGIYPIPFDMSDITEDDRKYYIAELDEINFSVGETDHVLISHRYDYTLYVDETQEITIDAKAFDEDGVVSFTLNGAPATNVMTVAAGDAIGVTVCAKGEEKHYTYTVTPTPEKCQVLHLNMKTQKDGMLYDYSGHSNHASFGPNTQFTTEDGRACFRPAKNGTLKITGKDFEFGTGCFTFSVWVKPDELNKYSTMLYYGDDEHSCQPRYVLRLQPIEPKPQKPQIGAPVFRISNREDLYDVAAFSNQVLEKGKWAQITVVHENINQKIYVNGKFAGERSYGVYMDVKGRNELLIGCAPDETQLFAGAIGSVTVHNYAMDDKQIHNLYVKERTEMRAPELNIRRVWAENEEYSRHRIPGIIHTSKGSLIIYNEARRESGDWAMMDIFCQRSEDGGKTFGERIYLAHGNEKNPTVNNPVMMEDKNGRLHLLYLRDYSIRDGGAWHRYSDDDGKTWSEERDITYAIQQDLHNAFAFGPGHGICLAGGRLLVPVWMVLKDAGVAAEEHAPSVLTSIYSDDCGESWQMGEILPLNPDVKSPNETVAVELADGSVMFNIRAKVKRRSKAISPNGSDSWTIPSLDFALVDPGCFGSIARAKSFPMGDALILVNCHSDNSRTNVMLKVSTDNGATWSIKRTLDVERGGYCDLAIDDENGLIYVLYEEKYGQQMYLATINYEWFIS